MDLQTLAVAAGLAGWTPSPVTAPKAAPTRQAKPAAVVVVVASPSGATSDWEKFAGGLLASRVIAVGEKHDESSHHDIQAKIISAVAERDPSVVVGLEMVSQDQQSFLDDFRSGKTSESEFSSWWKKNW